jgi:hypothetical protein
MKTLLFVHGDKGGVGKSTYAALAVDYLLEKYETVTVVEGDRKIPDIAERFADVDNVTGILTDLARPDRAEDAVIKLFEEIERSGASEHVVVNTPASASSTIDSKADLLIPVAHEMGYQVLVVWMVGKGDISSRLAIESELCNQADRKIAVINEFLTSDSAWKAHSVHKEWIKSGGLEGVLPEITSRVAPVLLESKGRYSDLTLPEAGQTIVVRQSIKNWLKQSWHQAVAPLYEEI